MTKRKTEQRDFHPDLIKAVTRVLSGKKEMPTPQPEIISEENRCTDMMFRGGKFTKAVSAGHVHFLHTAFPPER